MRREILDQMTVEEVKVMISNLEFLLKERYEDKKIVPCPLCHFSNKVFSRLKIRESQYCLFCSWAIFSSAKNYNKNMDCSFCYVMMKKAIGEDIIDGFTFVDPLNPLTPHYMDKVIAYRKRTIPIWTKKLNKYLEGR